MKIFAIILISLFSVYIVFSLVDIIIKLIKKRKIKNNSVSQSPSDGDKGKSM